MTIELLFKEMDSAQYKTMMDRFHSECLELDISVELIPSHPENNGSSANEYGDYWIELQGVFAKPDNLYTVVTAIHELGHLMDSMNFHDNHDYIKFYSMGGTELQAWKHSVDIAIKYGFDIDQMNDLYAVAIESARTYFNEDGFDDSDWEHMIVGYTGKLWTWQEWELDFHAHYSQAVSVLL